MKKQFFFGMVAAAALCGCSNNEVEQFQANEQNAIQFGTYVGQSTNGRAAVIDKTGMQTGTNGATNGSQTVAKGFGVFGYYTGQTAWSSSEKPNFMYNEKVTWNSSASPAAWEYTPVKYWPNNTDDQVSFFAYAPYDAGTASNFSFTEAASMTAPTFTFTVNPTVKSQQDLLWAAQTNKTKPTVGVPAKGSNNVWFTFAHALARVGFKAEAMFDKVQSNTETDNTGTADSPETTTDDNATIENGTKASATTIAIQKVELIGKFRYQGVINLENGTFADDATLKTLESVDANPTYTCAKPGASVSIPDGENTDEVGFTLSYNADEASSNFVKTVAEGVTTTPAKLNADDSYIMLIPKNFTGDDKIKIRVTYTVTTEDNKLPGYNSVITNVITSDDFTFNFEAKKAYTFNLHLGMTSVKFDADITDWSEQTGTVVNVPINKK